MITCFLKNLAVTSSIPPKVEMTQSGQIKRDSSILTTILQRHHGNQMAYDRDYAQLRDALNTAHPTAIISADQKESIDNLTPSIRENFASFFMKEKLPKKP